MRRIKLSLVLCLLLSVTKPSCAQVISQGFLHYTFGAFDVIETTKNLLFLNHGKLVIPSQILPGGALTPDIYANEDGILDAGQQRFNLISGEALPARYKKPECLQVSQAIAKAHQASPHIQAIRGHQLLRITLDVRPRSTLYDLRTCKTLAVAFINPEDSASFFEFRASNAGWWLLGSTDARLLISTQGKTWKRVLLPSQLQNVLSAYWPSPQELWLLGNEVSDEGVVTTVYKSVDQGDSWMPIKPEQQAVPKTWFEATRQLAADRLQFE